MITGYVRTLIDALAAVYSIPGFSLYGVRYSGGELLEAMVEVESGGDLRARRYEPHQDAAGRNDTINDPDRPGIDDGAAEDDVSHGPLQVMGSTWRLIVGGKVGHPLHYERLQSWGLGLVAGCEVLREDVLAVGRRRPGVGEQELVERALCRYNGGPSGDAQEAPGGPYRRQEYVRRIERALPRVRAARRAGAAS